jgi:hypothetical protein
MPESTVNCFVCGMLELAFYEIERREKKFYQSVFAIKHAEKSTLKSERSNSSWR